MPELTIAGHVFTLEVCTLADTAAETLRAASAAIFELFLEREAEFGVHPSVVIDYPDLSDKSKTGFLTDAAMYVAQRAESIAGGLRGVQTVVLTTYGDVVQPSFEAAGYETVHIDMPAGPDHTAAFVLAPADAGSDTRTLYIEAVNEEDEKIKPTFLLKLTDHGGRLCGGAAGCIHERAGARYAYLSTMALASAMPQGSGTALGRQLLQFLRGEGVRTVHLGTQTASEFYEKLGFWVDHRLVNRLRVRQKDGQEVSGDLVMLSLDL